VTLRLIREPSLQGATLGCLFVDGHWQAFTLEDELREVPGQPVDAWKVPGETAIPAGVYRVVITYSQRFQRPLPLLVDVPGFSGIRLHPGNTIADTSGCVLVGRDRHAGRVLQSRKAFADLFAALTLAGDSWIAIENPEA
jgi:hypothetical protein